MTIIAMTADTSTSAPTQKTQKQDNKLTIVIVAYSSLSVVFYGAVCWGAYRLVAWFVA